MAITNLQIVTGYYDSLGTPSIESAVTAQLAAGWIPHGAPVLTDVYGQVAQTMVKSTNLLTTAYNVSTGATPMAPDATWDAMGNPTWIESGRYLQAYTKGDQVSANIDLNAQVTGVLPIVNGGTGGNTPLAARQNMDVDRVVQNASDTRVVSPDNSKAVTVYDSGLWGLLQQQSGQWSALGIGQGGTGTTLQSEIWGNIRPTGATPLAADPVADMDAVTKAWAKRNTVTPSYEKVGTFAEGGTATANTSALLYNGMYYSPISGTLTATAGSAPTNLWVCVGELTNYSVDDPRNYGAKVGIPTFDSGPALSLWKTSMTLRYRATAFPSSRDDVNMFNMAGTVFDMSQGVYYTRQPLVFKDTFGVVLNHPNIVALSGFPTSQPVVEFSLDTGTRPLNGIYINDPHIDCNWQAAGCILLKDFWKAPVVSGLLSRYREYGIKTDYVLFAPHELNMALTHIAQQPVWDATIPSSVTEGVALDINNYDNNYTGLIVSQQVKDIAYLRKGAGSFVNCHFYPHQETDVNRGKLQVMSNADQFVDCYFDGCQLEAVGDGARFTVSSCNWLVPNHGVAINLIANPYQVKVVDCRFRNTTGVAMSTSVIRMKTIAEGRVSRPDIRDNYAENCTALSTVGKEYFTLTSTESARVVTRTIPDQYQPAESVCIQENSTNNNDDTWLLKARLISTSQIRMRPYNMNVGWSTTATYTGGVFVTYNL